MNYRFGNTVVIALGGSIMYPEQIDPVRGMAPQGGRSRAFSRAASNGIDTQFLKQFREFILKRLRDNSRFVIVAGGGRIARIYQQAAGQVANVADVDKDWIGIHGTRLNAHLLRTIFRDVADPIVIDSRHKIKKLRYPVTIASGWKPGWSTDYIAIALAQDFGAPEAIVAGKPAFVYPVRGRSPHGGRSRAFGGAAFNGVDDKDFDKNNPFFKLSWQEYRRLIPGTWKPGIHAPVDPVAAKLAEQKKIKAIIVDGKDLKNFSNLLSGKEFNGTIIN